MIARYSSQLRLVLVVNSSSSLKTERELVAKPRQVILNSIKVLNGIR